MGEQKKGRRQERKREYHFFERELKRSSRIIAYQLFTHSYNLHIIYIIRKFCFYFGSASLYEVHKITTVAIATSQLNGAIFLI